MSGVCNALQEALNKPPMRYEAEFDELFREGTDYGELLKRCFIRRNVDEPDEWRAEIRRQARRDQVRIRTFLMNEETGLVYAVKQREIEGSDLRSSFQLIELRKEAERRATALEHELAGWAFLHERAGARSRWCGARAYVAAARSPDAAPIMDGEALTEACGE